MKISFVAGFGPIVRDLDASLAFYRDTLGLPFEGDDDYIAANDLDGVRHFGQWRLEDAARSIFATERWPEDVPVPQANIEFDVDGFEALDEAARELAAAGYRVLVGPKQEPWGQGVVRLLGPEGLLIGITYTPSMHEGEAGRAG
jgi:catechol 2,3-dioxygenase-like lactoylglutathione lyase family enzyme